MRGAIKEIFDKKSQYWGDYQTNITDVFQAYFQDLTRWRSYMSKTLPNGVAGLFSGPRSSWNIESFHALCIACWIHHPVEKGAYMVKLPADPYADRLKKHWIYEGILNTHLDSRESSHLSGKRAFSASKGFEFLKGYKELLVQLEGTPQMPWLLLKLEGHTTGMDGAIPHVKSYFHKKKYGVGLTASDSLHDFAESEAQKAKAEQRRIRITPRRAENYSSEYEQLLKILGLKDWLKERGPTVTVREILPSLFHATGYASPYKSPSALNTKTNREVAKIVRDYCDLAQKKQPDGKYLNRQIGKTHVVTDGMMTCLRELAACLEEDGDVTIPRTYRELRVTAGDLDASLATFRAAPP